MGVRGVIPGVATTRHVELLAAQRAAPADLLTIHKFGKNRAVGTTFAPVALGGIYRTPGVGAETALRIKAGGNAADTAAGAGAREVTLYGVDATGAEVSEAVATAGIAASAATTTEFLRLFRVVVTGSGTYASASAGSHAGAITIENAAGTEDWASIQASDFPRGQSEIGAYTVPAGWTAFLYYAAIFTDSTKRTDVLCFRRGGVLITAAPFEAMRLVFETQARGSEEEVTFGLPVRFPENTDVGFMAKVDSGTAEVDVDFELLLIRNT